MTGLIALVAAALLLSSPEGTGLSGYVSGDSGEPLEGALVEDLTSGDQATTDSSGRFHLDASVPPVRLEVSKAGYRSQLVEVGAENRGPPQVRLRALEITTEEISVSAGVVHETLAPRSLAVSTLDVQAAGPGASSVTEIAAESASVSENGQGGLFQVISIRGVSGQRVHTLISGARIVGERRAGVSASFLDPRLLGSVEVVRGPSSSFYGSGALGGVLQLVPREFDSSSAAVGFDSEGEESYGFFGWGNPRTGWSLGLAHRRAGNAETPSGTPLNSGYRQTSSSISRTWKPEGSGLETRVQILSSWGSEIGKSNSDFPEEVTTYPRERHLVATVSVVSDRGWRANAFAHPNDLETLDLSPDGATALIENRAFDFGFGLRHEWVLRDGASATLGLETFSRRGVTADETRTTGDGFEESFKTLDDAELDEVGAFGSLSWGGKRARLEAGGRFTWQQQSNKATQEGDTELSRASIDETAVSAFLGVAVPLRPSLELVANVGTGLRFPNLSERFFVGTTGRGRVIGEPDLDPERSLNTDIGLRWFGPKHFLAIYGFRNEIEDYIERIRVAPDLRTFRNLTEGTLEGLEVDALLQVSSRWRLSLQGHHLMGRDAEKNPLADVPPDRLVLGALGTSRPWSWNARWQIRGAKTDPAGGELALEGGHLVSASLERELRSGLVLQATVTNLLDEELFLSADDLATQAPGRSWGVHLRWRG